MKPHEYNPEDGAFGWNGEALTINGAVETDSRAEAAAYETTQHALHFGDVAPIKRGMSVTIKLFAWFMVLMVDIFLWTLIAGALA